MCVTCTNSAHSVTNEVTIRQKINCAIALSDATNSTSLLKNYKDPVVGSVNYASIPYDVAASHKFLSEYDVSTKMFTNENTADCGVFTACVVKPSGCGSGAYSGKAAIGASPNFALSIRQNVDAGYEETLCVQC